MKLKYMMISLLLGITISSFQIQAAGLDPDRIDYIEKMAVSEASYLARPFRLSMSDQYSNTLNCKLSFITKESIRQNLALSSFVDEIDANEDCTVNVKFVNHTYMPSLSSQTLTFKMSPTSAGYMWDCSFSGQSGNIPSYCTSN
ncbi:hypothetical protein MTZ49_12275 [Entomomonas sp. E2T0]|uniref:pilin n=1 Tax=Entomomonas sp. E2T0 TaxID=2930213 RepID=UPI0022283154|nr:hypothetical protein [Entomomonas sp. E2T0]UYZ83366.1 hypothetical protein MTZ49_12275 [Entomomonas sp. E2T0]